MFWLFNDISISRKIAYAFSLNVLLVNAKTTISNSLFADFILYSCVILVFNVVQ